MKRLAAAMACIACTLLVQGRVQAGSIEYLSNESADYIRTFSRNATTDFADAVNYNPAGTAWMRDGLYLNLSSQTLFKFYSINYDGTSFDANDPTPVLPAFYAVYKWRHLAGFVAFTIPAGGGSLTYKSGIPYLVPLAILVQPPGGSPTNGRFEGSSMFLAPSFGAAYEFLGIFSISAVGRVVFARKSYKGTATYNGVVAELDTTKKATGFGGIFGVHVRPIRNLNIGIRFETPTPLEFESQTTSTNLNFIGPLLSFQNGAKEKRSLPAVLALGFSYTFFDKLTTSASWNYYFVTQADSEPDETGALPYVKSYNDNYSNGMDLGLAVEYRFIPKLVASLGYNHGFSGANAKTLTDFEYMLSSNSVGGGVRYTFWDRFDLTGAIAGTFYNDEANTALHPLIAPKPETYSKKVLTIAIGLQYRFF